MNEVGFTGTKRGMTDDQSAAVARLLRRFYKGPSAEFHHGEEPHSDAQAAAIAAAMGYTVVGHPGGSAKQNLQRNRDIVAVARVMIAAPYGGREILRSGTWATIRYTRKAGKPLFIVWPDGSIDKEMR